MGMVPNIPSSRHNYRLNSCLRRKAPGSDYSIVTLKSNGGKDVTQECGFSGGGPAPERWLVTLWYLNMGSSG
jgi:hypothetical protein